ncbi:hypothetical protein CFIMG_008041RA00001 [Ceratocystis fimbriata CBS 114723]|uniref:Uncharacterized protein n=1 Tax=Ceratocystis fimbriata CBS 114723 TaxID=1035309 RepID=A0A2C5X8M4_9PEZI|nr:hypothetical protein CFIMG_008041RA00001 [Ceratocystis fimbriata CBS 114723]
MPRRHATDATKYQQHTRSTSTMSRSITMEHLPRHAPPPTPPSLNPMPCQVRDKTGQFHVVPDTMAYLEIQAQPHAQFLPRLDSRNSPLLADDKSSAETIHSRSERFSLRLRKWLSLRGRAPMRE